MFDLLITGGLVYDGSGNAPVLTNIGIADGKIEALGVADTAEAHRKIDASGKCVTPGFIDMHSHADCSVPMWPDMENLLGQGITTCFAGHCSFSIFPVTKYWLEMDFEQAAMNQIIPEFPGGPIPDPQRAVYTEKLAPIFEKTYGEKLDWGDFKSFCEHLEKNGIGCNMSFQVGHSQLRQEAMGFSFNRRANEKEICEMERMLEREMQNGAMGLSIGLDYQPSTYADREELLRLMKIVARWKGVVTAHVQLQPMRAGVFCENHVAQDGYREFLELGLEVGVHVHISHLINGWRGAPKELEGKNTRQTAIETIDLIREYQKKGVYVTWDTLPYSTVAMFHFPQLVNYFRPYVDRCGGISKFVNCLRETNYGELIAQEIEKGQHASQSIFSRIDPKKNPGWAEKMVIDQCQRTEWIGKSIPEIAGQIKEDPIRTLLSVIKEDPQTTVQKNRAFDKESYEIFEQEEDATIGTDNGCCNYGVVYREQPDYPYYASTPSAFCGMVRCLEDTHLSKEKIIARLTGNAAKAAGYQDRGLLKTGMAADVLIIDFQNLKSNFSESCPQTSPDGIEYVIVNGRIAVENKVHTHVRSGKVLRRRER